MEPSSAEDGDDPASPADAAMHAGASMEPSSAEDGDLGDPIHSHLGERLQWSRPQLRTETGMVRTTERAQHRASMEPSSAEDGDAPAVRLVRCRGCASMEPSSAEDGDGNDTATLNPNIAASMEPSSAEDGDPMETEARHVCSKRLQWSRPQLRTETRLAIRRRHGICACFNGAVLS